MNKLVDALREALDGIRQYGSDTLSGRTDGPNDRAWQRGAVAEMTRRASAALAEYDAQPAAEPLSDALQRAVLAAQEAKNVGTLSAASDAFIEMVARGVKPIVESGEPTWEHAVIRAYERERGIAAHEAKR